MPLLFTDEDLDVMLSLRNAFNAEGVLNPGKLFPTTRMCAETRGAIVESGAGSGGHVSATGSSLDVVRELRAICGDEHVVRERPVGGVYVQPGIGRRSGGDSSARQ